MTTELRTWRLLVVDDDEEICNLIKEFLEGEKVSDDEDIQVEIICEFDKALEILEKQRFDLVILDLRVGSYENRPELEAGEKTLQDVKSRRFIPVIFHTGLSHLAEHLRSDLVDVIPKSGDLSLLLDAVRKMFETKLPLLNRALVHHVEEIQRRYMWDFVAKHWADFKKSGNGGELAYLFARRLALSLSVDNIQELRTELSNLIEEVLNEENNQGEASTLTHPVSYYVFPVISKYYRTGDLFKDADGNFYVLLTPSCDLVVRDNKCKADEVLLAKCALLTDQKEYMEWNNSSDNPKKLQETEKQLKNLMTNSKVSGRQEDRFYFLPGVQALSIPDLVIDFQRLHQITYADLTDWERVASLDRPYAESLSAKLTRYFGRIGTPDLNTQVVLERLRSTQISQEPQAAVPEIINTTKELNLQPSEQSVPDASQVSNVEAVPEQMSSDGESILQPSDQLAIDCSNLSDDTSSNKIDGIDVK
jgi:CheY-like chemotaxis protein